MLCTIWICIFDSAIWTIFPLLWSRFGVLFHFYTTIFPASIEYIFYQILFPPWIVGPDSSTSLLFWCSRWYFHQKYFYRRWSRLSLRFLLSWEEFKRSPCWKRNVHTVTSWYKRIIRIIFVVQELALSIQVIVSMIPFLTEQDLIMIILDPKKLETAT